MLPLRFTQGFLVLMQISFQSSTCQSVLECLLPIPIKYSICLVRFCDPLLEVQHQFCLDNVLGLLSRSLSNGWVAILTRLSSRITYALGFQFSLQKFKMPDVRMDVSRDSSIIPRDGQCLFPTPAGWSVCNSHGKALKSHRNLRFSDLLQTYTLRDLSQSSSNEWFTILASLSNHIEPSLHLAVFAVLSFTRRMLVCDSHGVLHSHRCFTSLPGFAVFPSKVSKSALFKPNGTYGEFVPILIGRWFCEGFGIPILFRLCCDRRTKTFNPPLPRFDFRGVYDHLSGWLRIDWMFLWSPVSRRRSCDDCSTFYIWKSASSSIYLGVVNPTISKDDAAYFNFVRSRNYQQSTSQNIPSQNHASLALHSVGVTLSLL